MTLYWILVILLSAMTFVTIGVYVALAVGVWRSRSAKGTVTIGASTSQDQPERAVAEETANRIARRTIGLSEDAQDEIAARIDQLRETEHLDDSVGEVHVSVEALVAGGEPPRTSKPEQFKVRIEHNDGRIAMLRVRTGRGGSDVDIRLQGDEPAGGLWTRDGRRVVRGADVRIESSDQMLVELLSRSLVFK